MGSSFQYFEKGKGKDNGQKGGKELFRERIGLPEYVGEMGLDGVAMDRRWTGGEEKGKGLRESWVKRASNVGITW